MKDDFDFVIEGYLFESITSDDFVVDSKVVPLFNKYKDILTDDYWIDDISTLKSLIDFLSPYFFVVYTETGEFCGYIYLSNWRSHGTCCAFHIVLDEKFHGSRTRKSARKIADKLFEKFGIRRIDCTIPIFNRQTIAFAQHVLKAEFEGCFKGLSIKNGKPLDYLVYAIVKGV